MNEAGVVSSEHGGEELSRAYKPLQDAGRREAVDSSTPLPTF